MCPDEPHPWDSPVTDGSNHHKHDEVGHGPRLTEGAGVTVSGGADRPTKKARQRRGNARRTGLNLVVRGVRRDPPDIYKLAQVVASLAAEMLEEETGEAGTDSAGTADQETSRRAA